MTTPAGYVRATPTRLYKPAIGNARVSFAGLKSVSYDPNQGTTNAVNMPRLIPMDSGTANWGTFDNSLTASQIISTSGDNDGFWMMCILLNTYFQRWVTFTRRGDPAAKVMQAIIANQGVYLQNVYAVGSNNPTNYGLGSNGSADGRINAADDFAWAIRVLMQLHIVTGLDIYLYLLQSAFINGMARWLSPYANQQVACGPFSYSSLGMPYTGGGQYNSTYEFWVIEVALYLHRVTNNGFYLTYAQAQQAMFAGMQKAPSGVYYTNFGINPNGSSYKSCYFSSFGAMQNGYTNLHFGATIAATLVDLLLYEEGGSNSYVNDAQSLITGMMKPYNNGGGANGNAGFLTAGNYSAYNGCFYPWTDPYTDPASLVDLARDVLPTVDPYDTLGCGGALLSTALSAVTQTYTPNLPGADWAGPLSANATNGLLNGYNSYQAKYNAVPGDQAGYQQGMVAASGVCAMLAGEEIAYRQQLTGA